MIRINPILIFLAVLWFLASQASASDKIVLEMNNSSANTGPTKIHMEYRETGSLAEASSRLEETMTALNQTGSKVFVSTDEVEIMESVVRTGDEKTDLIPYGSEVKPSKLKKFNHLLKAYVGQRAKGIQSDPIGFAVVAVTFGMEVVYWIHIDQVGVFAKTSNIIYSLLLAVHFGLDKDVWTRTLQPVQDFFRKKIGLSRSFLHVYDLPLRFFSHFALATVIASGRIGLLSLDSMVDTILSERGWSLALLASLVTTFSRFSWAENLVRISEVKQPLAKAFFRGVSDALTVTLGTIASTAMIYNPQIYGSSPWEILFGVGVAGLAVNHWGQSISNWIESQPGLQKMFTRVRPELRCRYVF